ncbi:hypothetical protein Fot_11261 [Forsythia ovata]|uniref:Uncharacterized protein n=1 Tax=Forsythia ovata TaxID=205694 RepID=A0ABD1WJ71_9LAMI
MKKIPMVKQEESWLFPDTVSEGNIPKLECSVDYMSFHVEYCMDGQRPKHNVQKFLDASLSTELGMRALDLAVGRAVLATHLGSIVPVEAESDSSSCGVLLFDLQNSERCAIPYSVRHHAITKKVQGIHDDCRVQLEVFLLDPFGDSAGLFDRDAFVRYAKFFDQDAFAINARLLDQEAFVGYAKLSNLDAFVK